MYALCQAPIDYPPVLLKSNGQGFPCTCVVVRMPNATVIRAKVIMFLLYIIFQLVLLKNTS